MAEYSKTEAARGWFQDICKSLKVNRKNEDSPFHSISITSAQIIHPKLNLFRFTYNARFDVLPECVAGRHFDDAVPSSRFEAAWAALPWITFSQRGECISLFQKFAIPTAAAPASEFLCLLNSMIRLSMHNDHIAIPAHFLDLSTYCRRLLS